jgi:prevent-host-death family protein
MQRMTQVTTLKRKATEVIAELNEHKEPILITEHGEPAAYLIDVKSYEEMQDRLEVLAAIARGEEDIRHGRVVDSEVVFKQIDDFLKTVPE